MTSNKSKIIGIAPILVVFDVRKSVEFYHDILGFEIRGFFPDADLPTYAIVRRDEAEIHFAGGGSEIRSNWEIRPNAPDLCIWTPQIDKFFDDLTKNGVAILQEIILRSYGQEFIFRDIDGHIILVVD